MKVLVDTNIVLDVWLDRESFVDDSLVVLGGAELGKFDGYLCATTITTLFYLGSKVLGQKKVRSELKKLLSIFEVSGVNRVVLDRALSSKVLDYEDAVLDESSYVHGVEIIVTRNLKDFKKSSVRAVDCSELIELLKLR